MASAPPTITVAPLEEKVAVVEQKIHNSQYALKFVGAAISSMFHEYTPMAWTSTDSSIDMASSAFCNPTDM